MRVLVLLVVGLVYGVGALPWSFEASGSLSLVTMDALNEWLAALAARQGAELIPLRVCLGGELWLWPWPFLGPGVVYLQAAGSIQGRESLELSASFLGAEMRFGLKFLVLGLGARIMAGLGGGWAWTRGLLEGNGWGWTTSVCLAGQVVGVGGLAVWVEVGYRWAQVGTLRTPREEFRPRLGPALDFSGPFGSLRISWSG